MSGIGPFSYNGEYYKIREAQFLPTPVQSPRIPIWVAGTWPIKAPFRRAAHWDGVLPIGQNHELDKMMPAEQLREITAYIEQHRKSDEPFDVVHAGFTSCKDRHKDTEIVASYAEAGVTWWLEGINPDRWGNWGNWPLAEMHQRILDGPPRA